MNDAIPCEELILIRHAEALKNLARERGGAGTGLTAAGQKQCESLSRALDDLDSEPLVLAYHDIPHVRETLDLIGLNRPCRGFEVAQLVGIHLGAIDGMSVDEAERRYPAAALALERWKAGSIGIDQMSLPGAEKLEDFEYRIRTALTEILGAGSRVAVFGTQSTLIMIQNILTLGDEFAYENYRHVRFPHCGGYRWLLNQGVPVSSSPFTIDGRE